MKAVVYYLVVTTLCYILMSWLGWLDFVLCEMKFLNFIYTGIEAEGWISLNII